MMVYLFEKCQPFFLAPSTPSTTGHNHRTNASTQGPRIRKKEEYSHAQQHSPFHVIALSVLDDVVRNQHTHEEDYRLERLKIQAHRLPHNPTEDHEKWCDQQCNLHTATNSYADGEVHLLVGHVVVSAALLECIGVRQKCCG